MYAKSGKWTCQVETDQIRLTKGGNDFRQIATVKMNSEVDLDLDMALVELNSSRLNSRKSAENGASRWSPYGTYVDSLFQVLISARYLTMNTNVLPKNR